MEVLTFHYSIGIPSSIQCHSNNGNVYKINGNQLFFLYNVVKRDPFYL